MRVPYHTFFLVIFFLLHFAYPLSVSSELIEPTRNAEGKAEEISRLTVLSEPPGYKISLDGDRMGKTPVFLVEVKPGLHKLRVGEKETEIYIEPGKTLKLSLFKNEFIEIPVEEIKAAEEKPVSEQQREVPPSSTIQPSPEQVRVKERRRQANERWMRFVDGSSPAF